MNKLLLLVIITLFIFSSGLQARRTGGRSGSRSGFSKRKQIRKTKINRVKTTNKKGNTRYNNRNRNHNYNNTNRRNRNDHVVGNVIRNVNNARIINHEINRNRRMNNRNRRVRRNRRRNRRYKRMTQRMKQRIFVNKVIKNKKGKRIDCQRDVGSWKWFKSVNKCIKKRGVKYE